MELLSMLILEFEFTFLILEFGAVVVTLDCWGFEQQNTLKPEVAWYPPPMDLVLLFTSLQQNECPFSMEQFEPSLWTCSNCKQTNFKLEVLLDLLWQNWKYSKCFWARPATGVWILVHLYHHHHYQQSSFLITFNTANPHLKIKPCSNTWKPVLWRTSGCVHSNPWQLLSNFQGSRILLFIWSCLGALDLLKLLKQQPCRVPLWALQNGVVLCWKLWLFLQRVLNSPTTHSALVSPHMEPHWQHQGGF